MFPARKTARMSQVLFERKFIESKEDTHLKVAPDKRYLILNGLNHDFQSEIMVSIGSEVNSREIIKLDPKSDLLIALYNDLKKELEDILLSGMYVYPIARTMEYVRKLFKSNKIEDVAAIRTAWQGEKYNGEPIIPLGEFIVKQVGVCRHYALLVCYFLDRLVKEGLLKDAKVYLARGHIKNGGSHAWAIFHEKDERDDACLVDAFWSNLPFFIKRDGDRLGAYGDALAQCKVRYLTPSVEYFKQLNPPGVELYVDEKLTSCVYKDKSGLDEINETYVNYGAVGNGSYGTVFEMRPATPGAKFIAIKQPKIRTTFPKDTSDEVIRYNILSRIDAVARELFFTRALNGGIGAAFCTDDPIVVTVAADGSKNVVQYPHFSLAMKYLSGTLLAKYKVKSAQHFCKIAIAVLEALERVHALNIVLEDIKLNNVKILEEKIPGEAEPRLVAQLFDHSISQLHMGYFSIVGLELGNKPADFKANFAKRKIVRAKFEDDIFCVGLMLRQYYDANFEVKGEANKSKSLGDYPIKSPLHLMIRNNPALRINLAEVIQSFKDVLNPSLNVDDLVRRIKISGHGRGLLFLTKLNILPQDSVDRFLNSLGLDFVKKIDGEQFCQDTNALHLQRKQDFAKFLLQAHMKELEKNFQKRDLIRKWCFWRSILVELQQPEFVVLDKTFFGTLFSDIQNGLLSSDHGVSFASIKTDLLSILQQLAPENRKPFLLYWIDLDLDFFDNLIQLNDIVELSTLLPAGENITTLFKSAVREKQQSFEVAFELSDEKNRHQALDQWLYRHYILFSLDQPLDVFQFNTVEHQFKRLQCYRDGEGVKCFSGRDSYIQLLIPTLKDPFPKNKMSLLNLIGAEQIKQIIPCKSSAFLDLFEAIPDDQKVEFVKVMGITPAQAESLIGDGYALESDAPRFRMLKRVVDVASEEQLAQKLKSIQNVCVRDINESKNMAGALDKWLFIECVLQANIHVDKSAAIEMLVGSWKVGEGVELFRRYIDEDTEKLNQFLGSNKDKLFFLQLIDLDVLRKMLSSSHGYFLGVIEMLSESERVAFLKMFGLEFLKSIRGLDCNCDPNIVPAVKAAFGEGAANFLYQRFALMVWDGSDGVLSQAIEDFSNYDDCEGWSDADRAAVISQLKLLSDNEVEEKSSGHDVRFFSEQRRLAISEPASPRSIISEPTSPRLATQPDSPTTSPAHSDYSPRRRNFG